VSRVARGTFLGVIAIGMTAILAFFLVHRDLARDPVPPRDGQQLAQWIAQHPADAIAASELADAALDGNFPQRRALWIAAFDHAAHLSPLRPNARAGFVRAGLFHWYELDDADRNRVLEVAAPLMRDPKFFARMYGPIWSLTRNFDYLRRVAPDSLNSIDTLRELALSRGLFPQYRELRETLRKRRLADLEERRKTVTHPGELVELLPLTVQVADAPLISGILRELEAKPFAPEQINSRIDPAIVLAIEHKLQPLAGIAPLLETRGVLRDVTRARAALALDRPNVASRVEISTEVVGAQEWNPYHFERALYEARKGNVGAADAQLSRAAIAGVTPGLLATQLEVGTLLRNARQVADARAQLEALNARPPQWSKTCGSEICATAETTRWFEHATSTLPIALSVSQSDETPPYVEIYANDALIAEGEVRGERTFAIQPGAGVQRIEVRLVNRTTRNGVQRRLRLS